MTEEEWISATNAKSLRNAFIIVNTVIPGEKYGVNKNELRDIIDSLYKLCDKNLEFLKITVSEQEVKLKR